MSINDADSLERLRRARNQLSDQFLHHPEVSLIDIGYDPEGDETEDRLVLRIHLRRASAKEQLNLPTEIDGIPVRVIVADYRLE